MGASTAAVARHGWRYVSNVPNAISGVTLSVGATGTDICPVAAMLGYMLERGSSHGPLFLFSEGQPVFSLRNALSECGLPQHYTWVTASVSGQ